MKMSFTKKKERKERKEDFWMRGKMPGKINIRSLNLEEDQDSLVQKSKDDERYKGINSKLGRRDNQTMT